ncbi:MAG: Na/Pi cotransporter family protein [Butyribacter sp.]|nr:Na/Pi cotransporter family protein [bacterium]MDY3853627.1 Na/Pi cotransporter family protein [Butyribacter sp.]
MTIFEFLLLIGGLALFLYGMNLMGDGLKQISGGKLEEILEKLTSNPIKGVLLGAGVTAIIQSSSATTVMVVGFVNSGMMQLEQTVGVIMGANIGTTVTSWLLSLTGIQGENMWIRLLEPSSFSPVLAITGVILIMLTKDRKKKDLGTIFVGFAIIMTGMEQMSNAVTPLKTMPSFQNLMIQFSNPLYGVLAGTILTAIIQSSSASVGILQALCATGAVPYSVAIPIIMGQNIGTCITAVLASIGASKNSKRTACIHLYFNLIGTILFLIVFYTANQFLHFTFLQQAASEVGIAVIHSAFNISATIVLLPFSKYIVLLAKKTLPDNKKDDENMAVLRLLDSRFLDKPGYAVTQAKKVTGYIAEETNTIFADAKSLLFQYQKENFQDLKQRENALQEYFKKLNHYLIQISEKNLSESDGYLLDMLLQCMGDFERIEKHTWELAEKSYELKHQKKAFSKQAQNDLQHMLDELEFMLKLTSHILQTENNKMPETIQSQKTDVENFLAKCKKNHIKRLRKKKCTEELGIEYMNILFHCGSILEHCVNIIKCFSS